MRILRHKGHLLRDRARLVLRTGGGLQRNQRSCEKVLIWLEGVNSLFKNSTNSLEQEVSKLQSVAFCSSSNGVFASHLSNNSS